MTNISAIMLNALGQRGKQYIYGIEDSPQNSNPEAFDCSELIEWVCARSGVSPTMPDGTYAQIAHCRNHNTMIDLNTGIHTWGALLFPGPDVHHVVLSLGDGRTMEARGAAYGVGIFSAYNRFMYAARIPGVDYTPAPLFPPPPQPQVVSSLSFPDGSGGWRLASDGGVFAWGRASFYGSYLGLPLEARQGDRSFVSIEPRGDGTPGYVLVSNRGERYTFPS